MGGDSKDMVLTTIYVKDGKRESIVRHRETDEDLAKAIIRRNKLK